MPASKRPKSSEPTPYWRSDCGCAVVYLGDCRDVMEAMEPDQFHAVVTDPPYELATSFHGGVPTSGAWDSTGVAYDRRTWGGVLRVARPGAHLMAFGGSRAHHRMMCAIEDSGLEIRDVMMWLYGSGYPKGLDVSKGIDAHYGAERDVVGTRVMNDTTRVRAGFVGRTYSKLDSIPKREVETTVPKTDSAKEWDGWNTQLRPAWEPIVVARAPMVGGVVENVLEYDCGAINVRGCRSYNRNDSEGGRWPANVITSHHSECTNDTCHTGCPANYFPEGTARFFYVPKATVASSQNRAHMAGADNDHPTIKPLDLMRHLVRLVCAEGRTVLDPFTGSGSTGVATVEEGRCFVGIEMNEDYARIAVDRLKTALGVHPVLRKAGGGRVVAADAAPPPPRALR